MTGNNVYGIRMPSRVVKTISIEQLRIGKFMRTLRLFPGVAFVLGLTALGSLVAAPAFAVGDDTGSTGSVTITKHANEAAKALAKQDYATAKYEYRQAIGLSPTTIEF